MSKNKTTAKSKQGVYYLGRVVFLGNLDKSKLEEALRLPESMGIGEHHWTVTEFKKFGSKIDDSFIFGKLTKYKPKGAVDVVDTRSHTESIKEVANTRVASSPFVYIPEYSGIVYLHVWNQIEQDVFPRRFAELVERKFNKFFCECKIEAVSDLQTFYNRISSLSSIESIQAKVNPPNPLFGPLWGPLKDYLKRRKVAELKIDEKADKGKEINSNLKNLVDQADKDPSSIKEFPDIADAAILMATDGYGHGRVQGTEGSKKVIISTSEVKKNFKYESDPEPIGLYEAAKAIFIEITEKRHMKHDKPNN